MPYAARMWSLDTCLYLHGMERIDDSRAGPITTTRYEADISRVRHVPNLHAYRPTRLGIGMHWPRSRLDCKSNRGHRLSAVPAERREARAIDFRAREKLAVHLTDSLPSRWRKKINTALADSIERVRARRMHPHVGVVATREVWTKYEDVARGLKSMRWAPNANDAELIAFAEQHAKECAGEMERFPVSTGTMPFHSWARLYKPLRKRLEAIAARAEIRPVGEKVEDLPAVLRYTDVAWWRRRVREAFGRAVEERAIRIGMVHRRADIYVSDENLARRQQQNKRNQRILENTTVANEDGQEFTLAQLAEKSVSNKVIRRGELMLRIRGMEEVANECGHVALFAVLTPPSRMHAVRVTGVPNPKYDGTTPRQAQQWHAGQWKKATAELHRLGLKFYGVRTVEPHHDGSPHWNVLLFAPKMVAVPESRPRKGSSTPMPFAWPRSTVEVVKGIFTRYWLDSDSADEPGAKEHRVRYEVIDQTKGSATAYVAKYISKGIDGQGMDEDLFGNPIVQTTQRIEAWATLWGIRQFQTMCSASVTVWRELRRIPRERMVGAPIPLQEAWLAAQKIEGDGIVKPTKAADFGDFIRAVGGPRIARDEAQLWIEKKEREGLTRYAETPAPIPSGVGAGGSAFYDKGGIVGFGVFACVPRAIESVRKIWTVIKTSIAVGLSLGAVARPVAKGISGSAGSLSHRTGTKESEAISGLVGVAFDVPRTRVNNYTTDQSTFTESDVDASGYELGSFARGSPRSERAATEKWWQAMLDSGLQPMAWGVS